MTLVHAASGGQTTAERDDFDHRLQRAGVRLHFNSAEHAREGWALLEPLLLRNRQGRTSAGIRLGECVLRRSLGPINGVEQR